MLKYAMPLYEAKYHEEDEWMEISEIELMDQLYKTYTKVSPAIKEMILGKELETRHGSYRLKLKGGVQGEEKGELSAA
jgi:hypothetical protein